MSNQSEGDGWETRKEKIWDWLHTQKDLAFAIASVEPVKGWWGGRPMERHELSALLRRNGISTEFDPDEILRAFREGCPHLKPKF